VAGDKTALNEQQVRGMELFSGQAACADCHTPPVFSNGNYYNAGVGSNKQNADPGRKKVTNRDSDAGKFRVPHLRNVADTGPYFHDGSVEKLDEAVRIMATGGIENPNLSPSFKGIKAAKLSDEQIGDLVAFVKALSGEYPIISAPDLP
jgi:cytochrome c peroxidase